MKLNYRGFIGSSKYSPEDKCYYGVIENTQDLVTYESDKLEDLEIEFQHAVDAYLEFKEELSKEKNGK